MRLAALVVLSVATLAAPPAAAQHVGQPADPHAPPQAKAAQPYAGLEERRIKAVSEQQEADLMAGRGMGLALAAELNGYPGPMHVLEHADALRLAPGQRVTAAALRNRMAEEARTIGARILALEEELDALFARGKADAGKLAALTSALGALGGRLREVHLTTHIGMREALSSDQLAAYARLRGYTGRSQRP